jgi:adenosylmethionine-8-amino-7-oxononanoate aminotransferase
MSRSHADLLAADRAHLIHPLHNPTLHETAHIWTRGEGALLFDAEGHEFIDVLSGLWNVVAGHGRTELVEAASRQAGKLSYCSLYSGSSNVPAIELAERLAGMTYPSINRFFFTSGGGESIESCLKTARYYWHMQGQPDKTRVICRSWAYHGTTTGATSATGMQNYWPMFEPRTPGFVHIPSPYPYRYEAPAGVSPGIAMANELEQAILREGPETVAMFLAEPVHGAAGVIIPPDDYFPRVREICDQYNVLLGMDEIVTGFGRTGRWFGLEHWGIEPDIMTFAKAITSGYFPLGGIGLNDEIAETLDTGRQTWMHAFTYSGHPVGCAVALANLDLLERDQFPQQAVEKGGYLLSRLRERLSSHPHVGEIRGIGLMAAVEFVKDRDTREEFPAAEQVGHRVHVASQQRGLFTRLRGDNYCIAPPYVITLEQIDQIVDRLTESIVEVLGE